MNLGWRCDQRCAHLLLMVIAIYVQHIIAFHSPSLSFPPANRMTQFGKARTATNRLKVSNSLVDDVLDVEVYNQPTIQRSKISSDETIGIGLANTSPGDRQVATSSRTKGIDWTYEMVRLFYCSFCSSCSDSVVLFTLSTVGRRIILTSLAVQTETPRN